VEDERQQGYTGGDNPLFHFPGLETHSGTVEKPFSQSKCPRLDYGYEPSMETVLKPYAKFTQDGRIISLVSSQCRVEVNNTLGILSTKRKGKATFWKGHK
jgi:hypothetical protein